jgi:type VI protein secretion system component VasK
VDENASIDLTDAESGDRESLLQQATDLAKQRLLGQAADAGGLLNRARRVSTIERAFKPLTAFGVPPAETKPDAPPPPTGLTQYQALLKKLIGVLSDVKAASAPADPKALTGEFEIAFRTTSGLLADQDAFTRPLLSPLLLDPITATWASVLKDAGGAAGGIWEVTAYKAWSTKLLPLYPFDEGAREDVRLDDFASFFRPQTGQLWAYYDQTLKGSVDIEGDDFVPSRRFQSKVAYSEPFLTCLRDAKKLTDAFFDVGAKDPSLVFDVKLHSVSPDVSEVTLEIDGVAHTYRNAPEEWTHIDWPAKDAKARGGRVKVTGLGGLDEEILRSGDFGLIRLLAAAEVKPGQATGAAPGDPPVLVATWNLKTQKGSVVKMDLRPARSSAPFQRGFFSELRCPRLITSEAR